MLDQPLKPDMKSTAQLIGSPRALDGLHNSQLEFWVTIQSTMQHEGYEAVRKRFSFISEDLAGRIEKSSIKNLLQLCSGQISTLRPSLPDDTLIEMLLSSEDVGAKAVLQILSEAAPGLEVCSV